MVEGIDKAILVKIIFGANWKYWVHYTILFTLIHAFKNFHNENILKIQQK